MGKLIKYIVYLLQVLYAIFGLDLVLDHLNSPGDRFYIGVILLTLYAITLIVIIKVNKKIFKK